MSVTRVRRVISTYNRLGIAAIETPSTGGRRQEDMSLEQERSFLQPFFARAEKGEITTAEQIQQACEAEVKHAVHSSSISRLLDRHGWRKLVARPRHPKANPEEQAALKKTFRKRFKQHSPHESPTMSDLSSAMAEDEGRLGRISIPRRAWAPPGVRPYTAHQVVREYTYVYAAVAPAEGKMLSLILPSADTEMMSLVLDHVSTTFANSFLVMQVDQAGWHGSKDLKIPAQMRLIAQPAYSPEVKPVEHVWEELREKHLANLALASLDEVIDTVCEGLNRLEANPERLRSMTYFPHYRSVS